MPESKTRKAADAKKKIKRHEAEVEEKAERARTQRLPSDRQWIAPLFITLGILGALWIVVFYIAGYQIPVMKDIGLWNLAIGMGLLMASFITMTFWK